jgi:hypothetical protein
MTASTVTAAEQGEDHAEGRSLRPLAVAAFLALVFALALRPALDGDLWWHLRTAEWMVDHLDWVGVDPFTHTRPGVARVQTDWLAQLTFFATWRVGGLMAVSTLLAAVATAGTYLVYRTTSGPLGLRLGVTGLVAAASSVHWVARPQMFSFFFTALVYLLVRTWRRQGGAWIWWLVPIIAVWTNVHGGVIYGMLILGAVVAGEWIGAALGRAALDRSRRLQLTAVVAVATAAMSLNPSGVRVYGLPFHQVAASVEYIDEFRPPQIGDVWVWPFFVLVAATTFVVAKTWRRFDAAELLPLLAGIAMAARFTRSIPFFAVIAAPIITDRAMEWWCSTDRTWAAPRLTERDRSRLRLAAGAVIVVALGTAPFRIAPGRVEDQRQATFPVAATEWLVAEQPPGELFNTFNWGGYLMLHAPEYRVAVDSRTDVYDEYLDVYVDTVSARSGWQDELDREGVSTVLVNHTVPLARALADEPGWDKAYEDDVAVIFTRS